MPERLGGSLVIARPVFWYALGVMLLAQAVMRAADGVFNGLFWMNVVVGALMLSTGVVQQAGNRSARWQREDIPGRRLVFEKADGVVTHEEVLRWLPDHVRADLGFPVTKREAVGQTGLLGIPYPVAADTNDVPVVIRGNAEQLREIRNLPLASTALVPEGTPIPGWARYYFQPEPPRRPSPTRGELR